jgi:protein-L-isoaspartate(D-aspartate) O-methyltransferase
MARETESDRFIEARQQMVDWQLRPRNITDGRVLKVMAQLPREGFIPPEHRATAYEDRAGPIGEGQTISQPYMVALMTEKLHVESHHRVLEIGTGSGYQTAVLGKLAKEVYTVERIAELSRRARETLGWLGILNVSYKIDDGTGGWAEQAPFDRILVTAGAPEVPISLPIQLADGGLLIIPVGPESGQMLMRVRRMGKKFDKEPLVGCRFVKLIGQEGWPEEDR